LSFLNYSTKEINFKIVYYGPGLSGKTTNIKYIYSRINKTNKGKLVSLATETERTLFFDFVPFDLGTIKGYKIKIHLYTVPGQIYYSSSRKLILKGVDGVIFVADSQNERFEANLESLADMLGNLKDYNISFQNLPYILQLNKRDLPNITPADEMVRALRKKEEPVIESIALKGTGVVETLKKVSKMVMMNVRQKLK